MRVLIVLAHKNSARGKQLSERFIKQVRGVFAACPNFSERLDILVRSHSQLGEFIPPPATPEEVPDIVHVRDRITSLDGIDFVFLDGDDNLLPWSRPAAAMLQLLHLCLASGKVVFGCGCAVQLLAYLACVGPVQVPVLNGGGKGGTLRSFGSERPPPGSRPQSAAPGIGRPSSSTPDAAAAAASEAAGGLLLERQTGDLFRFDAARRAWAPVGNVGVHCALGASQSSNDASKATGINRSDGVGPCEIIQNERFHFLFDGVWPAKLVVPESNEWHCHLPTFDTGIKLPTGTFELKALATSRLGAQVVECRNAVGLQFRPEDKFPQTMRMMQNFVNAKIALMLGEGAHGDPPSRILEMAARDPRHSDLVQQLLRSLAPPTSGILHSGPPSRRPDGAAGPSPEPGQMRPRPFSAASAPNLTASGQPKRSTSASALGRTANTMQRPGTPGGVVAGGPGAAPASSMAAAPSAAAAYTVRPEAALTYLNESRAALATTAEQVHMGRETIGTMNDDVPLFTAKPPRPSSAGPGAPGAASSRPGSRPGSAYGSQGGGGGGASRQSQMLSKSSSGTTADLVPRIVAEDLILDGGESAPADAPAQLAQMRALQAAAAAKAARPRTVRVKRASGKPFSNYQKYEAMTNALVGHTIHVTSVGPYVSKLEQINLDEQDKKNRSIHRDNFKPGGLWDKYEAPPGGWGFAAAGFVLPDDLPATARNFGSFYNTHAHRFRWTEPKKNLYM